MDLSDEEILNFLKLLKGKVAPNPSFYPTKN